MNDQFGKLNEEQRKLIVKHLELVIEANKMVNLTRIDSFDEAMVLHVEDSLQALPEMNAAPKGNYADIGSGGGFPGIPLAIATGRKTCLVDARKKKMDTVQGIVEELGISDFVSVYAGRAELLSRSRDGSFSVITARALSKLSVIMELASPLLAKQGHLICFKSTIDSDEMNNAKRVCDLTGMRMVSQREFLLEDSYRRSLIVFEKVAKPKLKLPRQEGMAQKKPL